MKEILSESFARLQRKREAIIDRLSRWTPEQLNFRPGPGQWNCVQVLHHVQLVEYFACASIGKEMATEGTLPKVTLRSSVTAAMLRALLKLPLKLKIPTPRIAPDKAPSFETVTDNWRKTREELNGFLEKLPDSAEKKAFYKHPLAGWLNARQTLKFLDSHFDHHLVQIRRIERAPRFPR